MQTLVERVAKYVEKRLEDEKTGHDWTHVYRVWQIAKVLQHFEGGDLELIELAALLHSVSEHNSISADNLKKATSDDQYRLLAMEGILDSLGIDGVLKEKLLQMGEERRFRSGQTKVPKTLEAKIVQDANWLDGLGAIGIGRVFTAGGYMGRRMYDPEVAPAVNTDYTSYLHHIRSGTTINYFFEKTLQAAKLLNTATARQIAKKRVAYIEDFVAQFKKEWDGGDISTMLTLNDTTAKTQ